MGRLNCILVPRSLDIFQRITFLWHVLVEDLMKTDYCFAFRHLLTLSIFSISLTFHYKIFNLFPELQYSKKYM